MTKPAAVLPDRETLEHELELLDALLRSEGWALAEQHAVREWRGEGYFARMGAAMQTGDATAAHVVHKTSIGVQDAFEWPRKRVAELRKKLG